jgi:hypothetical protein
VAGGEDEVPGPPARPPPALERLEHTLSGEQVEHVVGWLGRVAHRASV